MWLKLKYQYAQLIDWLYAKVHPQQAKHLSLVSRHEKCCGAGAKWAVDHPGLDHRTASFGGYGLEQAYLESERLGCALSGWERRLVVYTWAAKHLGMI